MAIRPRTPTPGISLPPGSRRPERPEIPELDLDGSIGDAPIPRPHAPVMTFPPCANVVVSIDVVVINHTRSTVKVTPTDWTLDVAVNAVRFSKDLGTVVPGETRPLGWSARVYGLTRNSSITVVVGGHDFSLALPTESRRHGGVDWHFGSNELTASDGVSYTLKYTIDCLPLALSVIERNHFMKLVGSILGKKEGAGDAAELLTQGLAMMTSSRLELKQMADGLLLFEGSETVQEVLQRYAAAWKKHNKAKPE